MQPGADLLVLEPARGVDLVPAQEDELGLEDPRHFLEKVSEEGVDVVVGGVEDRGAAHEVRVALAPRPVARNVELGHHHHPAGLGISHDALHVIGRIDGLWVEGSLGGEVGKGLALAGEGLRVDDVPVQHVQLVQRHDVDDALDVVHGQKVPRRVHQQAAEGEPGNVGDLRQVDFRLGLGDIAQLGQGRQRVQRPVHGLRLDRARRVGLV
mmetsp:Transcript_2856/g.7491  ORF Transcript_2856/g.7491 Transcript_2856/m.7491 type:complete len:210 (+) Transcript_2856:2036-2665(+)